MLEIYKAKQFGGIKMVIGIIAAMEEELEILLQKIESEKCDVKARMKFNIGSLYNNKVVAVVCGIGKVNAAVCTQILIDDYDVNMVINVGVAGGVREDVLPGHIVVASELIQHDIDTTVFGDKIGQVPRLDTFAFKCDNGLVNKAKAACEKNINYKSFIGRIVTGDQFIADIEKITWLGKEFEALACEMEGGSIAQVCYLNGVPFVVLRSISDNASTGAHMEYEKFKLIAAKNSTDILVDMLKNI